MFAHRFRNRQPNRNKRQSALRPYPEYRKKENESYN